MNTQTISLFALALSCTATAEELGRLFYTPEKRTQLEAERVSNTTPAASANVMSIDGIVQRHGGERTVWINGVSQIAGQSDDHTPESVRVAIPGKSQPVKIKVGQKVIVDPDSTKE